MRCNAYTYNVGAVLAHCMSNGLEQPIGFVSRILTTAEKNSSQTEKEALLRILASISFMHTSIVTTLSLSLITSHY